MYGESQHSVKKKKKKKNSEIPLFVRFVGTNERVCKLLVLCNERTHVGVHTYIHTHIHTANVYECDANQRQYIYTLHLTTNIHVYLQFTSCYM